MIKCAAGKRGGQVWEGHRHPDVIRAMVAGGCEPPICGNEQGFVTDDGRYVDRKEALQIAIECGQVAPDCQKRLGILFSEDLY